MKEMFHWTHLNTLDLKPVTVPFSSSRTTACRHLDHPPPPRRMRYGGATFLPSSSTPASVFLYLARERTLPFRPPCITCPTSQHTLHTLLPSHLPRLHGNCSSSQHNITRRFSCGPRPVSLKGIEIMRVYNASHPSHNKLYTYTYYSIFCHLSSYLINLSNLLFKLSIVLPLTTRSLFYSLPYL